MLQILLSSGLAVGFFEACRNLSFLRALQFGVPYILYLVILPEPHPSVDRRRISMAGLNSRNVHHLADAIHAAVTRKL